MPAVPLPLIPAGSDQQHLAGSDDGGQVCRSVLPGGVRVLTEEMPGLRSATIGCWIGVGSRDEADGHHGSTHFLEHLLFKGTARRNAMDIAVAFDEVGGDANAVTGKEYTAYYARVLDEDLDLAIDVLLDMVTSARLENEDVESERGVILEELAMNEDDPSDVAHEAFAKLIMGEHPLGRPIGGTTATIEAVGRDDIWDHYTQHYTPATLVITAAGGLDHDAVVERVGAELMRSGWPMVSGGSPAPRRPGSQDALAALAATAGTPGPDRPNRFLVHRQIEQANILLGTVGLTATDERRHVMSALNAVLGGGMSSRLFQEIREKRGLAYSVYSFASGYSDSGYFGLYAGCAPHRVAEVINLLGAGLDELAEHGVSPDELARAQGQLRGGLVLGLEDSSSRMTRLGRAELIHGEFIDLAEALARIQAITPSDIQELAAELAARPRSLTVVGPAENLDALPDI